MVVQDFRRVQPGNLGIGTQRQDSAGLLVSDTAADAYCRHSSGATSLELLKSQHCGSSPGKASGFGPSCEEGYGRIRSARGSQGGNTQTFYSNGTLSRAKIPLLLSLVFDDLC